MKKALKIFVIAAVGLFNALILFRIFVTFNKSEFKSLVPTDGLRAAYSEDADITVLSHKFLSDLSANRYFTAYAFHYAPAAREIQVTVRLNRGAYAKAGVPEGEEFSFILRNSATEEQTRGVILAQKDWMMYRFFRVGFENAVLEDGVSYGLVLEGGDGAADEIILHHKDQEYGERTLTKDEANALSGE